MFPQMASTLFNWGKPTQMKVVTRVAVDFEVQEDVLNIPTFDMMLINEDPQVTMRRPEGERQWKFWDAWSTQDIDPDTVIKDFKDTEYRVSTKLDGSQTGVWHYKLVEQPRGL